jgi:hypothetical protein
VTRIKDKDTLSEDTEHKHTLSEDTEHKDTLCEDTEHKGTLCEDTEHKDTLRKDLLIFIIISRSILLRMRNVSDKICGENQNTFSVQ